MSPRSHDSAVLEQNWNSDTKISWSDPISSMPQPQVQNFFQLLHVKSSCIQRGRCG